MGYWEEYKRKLTTPEAVAATVKSHSMIKYGYFNGKPQLLDKALAARHEELVDVILEAASTVPPVPEVIQHKDTFTYQDWHWSKLTRMLANYYDNVIYSPVMYHIVEQFISMGEVDNYKSTGSANWQWIQVAPMDEHGYFNFGPSNSESLTSARTVAHVCVEVVPTMPRCLGGQCEGIHISEVDAIVEAPEEQRIFAVPDDMPGPTEVEMRIAEHILPFMQNGSCIQLGIGGLPNALGACIAKTDLKDLGVHTEMLVDAYVDMIESGQMNGCKKQIDKGRAVYTFAVGTQRLYDWMHNNTAIASYNVEYTNNPRNIALNDNFISINQAMQLDMFSNVSAESMGTTHITGCGGMLDFTLGAQWSKDGKSFVCLPSTRERKDGTLESRIVGTFPRGTNPTLTRHMIDYVVTEYGVKKMRAQNIWVRAENLIDLAHPQFRDALVREANELKIWTRTNRIDA
ncbi:MAG: acetyl-CoA hydrolase/transferase family protein [Methylocystaceae bacterium]